MDADLDSKPASAVDSLAVLNICFNEVPRVVREIDKGSFIY